MEVEEFRKELESQKQLFEQIRDELLKRFPRKFVAICKNQIAGIGDTYDEAIDKAWKNFQHGPIYVGKAVPKEEEETWLMV